MLSDFPRCTLKLFPRQMRTHTPPPTHTHMYCMCFYVCVQEYKSVHTVMVLCLCVCGCVTLLLSFQLFGDSMLVSVCGRCFCIHAVHGHVWATFFFSIISFVQGHQTELQLSFCLMQTFHRSNCCFTISPVNCSPFSSGLKM